MQLLKIETTGHGYVGMAHRVLLGELKSSKEGHVPFF
jgi:hypothetical protein